MELVVEPSEKVSGKISPSPSKFCTQFATAIGLLAEGKSVLKSPLVVDDTRDLAKAIETLGATTKRSEKTWSVWGNGRKLNPSGQVLDAKKSIISLSLLASISSLISRLMVITGKEQVRNPPVPTLISSLQKFGVDIHSTKENDSPPLFIFESDIKGGEISLDENTDPRFVPALVLISPFADEKVELELIPKLRGHLLGASIDLLKESGVELSVDEERLTVSPGEFDPIEYTPPLDIFSTIPYVTAAIITGSELEITGIEQAKYVEDFEDLMRKIGVELERTNETIKIPAVEEIKAAKIDLEARPELLPFFAVLACSAEGKTELLNATRARRMKSDRIKATTDGLTRLGADVSEQEDGMTIKGPVDLEGGEVDGHDDVAIVASLGVAGLKAKNKVTIKNRAEALRQSYPHFVTKFKELGAEMQYKT